METDLKPGLNGKIENPEGRQTWFRNGAIHREDGPAVIRPSGTQEWFINGKRHREDGPAVVGVDGRKEWFINGKRHREDGPAIEVGSSEITVYGLDPRGIGFGTDLLPYTKLWFLRGKLMDPIVYLLNLKGMSKGKQNGN